jgi:hypothetical protein
MLAIWSKWLPAEGKVYHETNALARALVTIFLIGAQPGEDGPHHFLTSQSTPQHQNTKIGRKPGIGQIRY